MFKMLSVFLFLTIGVFSYKTPTVYVFLEFTGSLMETMQDANDTKDATNKRNAEYKKTLYEL